MKTSITITTLVFAGLLASCEKEINLKLKENDKQVVIEGNITNITGAEINISKTTAFSNSNEFPEVTGAEVTISDNEGNTEKLTEVAPGKYRGTTLIGVSGRSYYMTVKTEDKSYTAISTIPSVVNLDTLVGKEEVFFGNNYYNVYPVFKDEAGTKNYYRFLEYINGKKVLGSTVMNDELSDGNYNVLPISNDPTTVKDGDVLELEMQNIDKTTYDYFRTMSQSDMGGSAPSNPVTNIQGGALGYFSAHTIQKKSLIVIK